jgi:hypothetical protein
VALGGATAEALLGQQLQPEPPTQRWAASLIKHVGVDPLVDASGDRMQWVGHSNLFQQSEYPISQHESQTFSEPALPMEIDDSSGIDQACV